MLKTAPLSLWAIYALISAQLTTAGCDSRFSSVGEGMRGPASRSRSVSSIDESAAATRPDNGDPWSGVKIDEDADGGRGMNAGSTPGTGGVSGVV